MSKKKTVIPDAWDDDWEVLADRPDEPVPAEDTAAAEARISKAERLARHAEENKKLWDSAEKPEPVFFLAARSDPPLKTEFKPALKVLSRKPATPAAAVQDGEEEEDESKKNRPSPEELRARAERERAEKQRKYEEARARLFGKAESAGGSGRSTPGTVTPPGNGRGRGGRGRGRGGKGQENNNSRPNSQSGTPGRELYDPNYTAKPGSLTIQKRETGSPRSGSSTPRLEEQIVRAPRGPDGTGRGGAGFVGRGGKTS